MLNLYIYATYYFIKYVNHRIFDMHKDIVQMHFNRQIKKIYADVIEYKA